MMSIPDAPWIRDAEMYGVPEAEEVKCPICGKRTENFVLDRFDNILGCDECLRTVDAWEWTEDHREEG